MDPYAALFRGVLFPVWESGVRGRPTLEHLRELEKRERDPAWRIAELQARDLRKLIAHAFENVPFYRARFLAAKLAPSDIHTAEDLVRLPLVRRPELRDSLLLRESIAPPFPTISKSTSGTMGTPLSFAYDRDSEHWRQAIKLRGYGWAGYRPGDRTVHYWGRAPGTPARATALKVAADRALRQEVYLDCGSRSAEHLDHAARELARLRPRVLVCFAQAGADLARHVNQLGLRDWPDIRVVCGAERLLPIDREEMRRAFGPHVFETYGCRETMLIASECEAHDGMHLSEENLIVEIIVRDGDGERAALPGEVGEVVITDLHNFGMPFIRYANGDLAALKAPGVCACGRALARLSALEGRVTETLRDGAGAPVSGLVFNVVMVSIAHAIRQFQAVQHKDGSLTLNVVPSTRFDDGVRAALIETARTYLPGVPITLKLVEDIPALASGKRQVVVVER